MAIGFGIFLSLFVYFAVTTCSKLQWPLLSTRIVEKNEEALSIHVMAEEFQLEIQSRTYSAVWSSLEQIAQFLKAEYKGRTKEKLLATSALRRRFKISGQIREPEQKDKVSFSSLARQIQTGLAQGYVESEIVDGVICSIIPEMVLRSYLETYKDLTLDRLKKILRSHYGAKNTSELYQTLTSLCQTQTNHPRRF